MGEMTMMTYGELFIFLHAMHLSQEFKQVFLFELFIIFFEKLGTNVKIFDQNLLVILGMETSGI